MTYDSNRVCSRCGGKSPWSGTCGMCEQAERSFDAGRASRDAEVAALTADLTAARAERDEAVRRIDELRARADRAEAMLLSLDPSVACSDDGPCRDTSVEFMRGDEGAEDDAYTCERHARLSALGKPASEPGESFVCPSCLWRGLDSATWRSVRGYGRCPECGFTCRRGSEITAAERESYAKREIAKAGKPAIESDAEEVRLMREVCRLADELTVWDWRHLVDPGEHGELFIEDGEQLAKAVAALRRHRERTRAEGPRERQPACPGDECPMCTGAGCAKCGAGFTRNPVHDGDRCEHDVIERHEEPGAESGGER